MSSLGTAMLKEGQYIDAYKQGLHKGQYTALVQDKPVTTPLVDPDFDSRLKAWVIAGLQTIHLCSESGSIPIQMVYHFNVRHI